jgi:SAM-dependent methyltransferase
VINKLLRAGRRGALKFGIDVSRHNAPLAEFHSDHYLRHNARRLEHLASLQIPVAGKSVLEVGAGIGDHSHFYLDRGCKLTTTEARSENLDYLRARYPEADVRFLDMEQSAPVADAPFDVVHCYGLLYHLNDPEQALAFLGENTGGLLLLETCVSFGDDEAIHLTAENPDNPSQAFSGTGCRPTRPWVFKQLQALFEYVYLPLTQPAHEEFPIDWTAAESDRPAGLTRAIFVASRNPLDNGALTASLLDRQTRQI